MVSINAKSSPFSPQICPKRWPMEDADLTLQGVGADPLKAFGGVMAAGQVIPGARSPRQAGYSHHLSWFLGYISFYLTVTLKQDISNPDALKCTPCVILLQSHGPCGPRKMIAKAEEEFKKGEASFFDTEAVRNARAGSSWSSSTPWRPWRPKIGCLARMIEFGCFCQFRSIYLAPLLSHGNILWTLWDRSSPGSGLGSVLLKSRVASLGMRTK